MRDSFYDYSKFDNERLKNIMTGWNGFIGNHGAVIKFCAERIVGSSVLDVGCGLCHLYKALVDVVSNYVGVDNDKRVIDWAIERYPELRLIHGDARNLSFLGKEQFDTVYAIGLYRVPSELTCIEEMLKHSRRALIVTYLHRRDMGEKYLPAVFFDFLRNKRVWSIEVFAHKIKGIEIVRFNLRI